VSTQATGTFKIDSWDEEPHGEGGGVARAAVKQTFSGDIEGEGQTEWVMCYRADKTADFVGYLRLDGRIGERSGALVFRSTGAFDGKEASGPLTIVEGSGTGDLEGIAGGGSFSAPMGGQPSVALDYDFA
jgi:hypothetical protein